MNRLNWTDWMREAASEAKSNRDACEMVMAYGEWLEERLQVLPDDLIDVLAQEFCL